MYVHCEDKAIIMIIMKMKTIMTMIMIMITTITMTMIKIRMMITITTVTTRITRSDKTFHRSCSFFKSPSLARLVEGQNSFLSGSSL